MTDREMTILVVWAIMSLIVALGLWVLRKIGVGGGRT